MQRLFVILVLIFAVSVPVMAQDTPSVDVSDQVSLDGTVRISSVFSEGPGFVVIHQDDGSGSFGAVIGQRAINAGQSVSVNVPIDVSMATPTLFAMLHVDDNEAGVYEFGSVEGADAPVIVDGAPVSPAFNVDLIRAGDQIVDGSVIVANVTAQADGFMVIHADMDGSFGAVIGFAPISAGQNSDVLVNVDQAGVTSTLWPMLHVDTGTIGDYEFGAVEGADNPVVVNGTVAVTSIETSPHLRVADQIVMHGDSMEMMDDMVPTLTAQSVFAEVDGFLVVHQEVDGSFGPVAGVTPVSAGVNFNVVVELDPAMLTPRLWPMLHVDTGAIGEYEFGTVEGADGPVVVDGNVVTFPINAAPALELSDQPIIEAMMGLGPHIFIDTALIDAPGWIAIHSSVDGGPGPVIATAPVVEGLNTRVVVELDPTEAGTQVFPMLHYDTGALGIYEFGTVEGADGPVSVAGNVIVGPLNITESMDAMGDDMADDAMTDDEMTDDQMADDSGSCTVTAFAGSGANLRMGPSTSTEIQSTLTGSESAMVNGQARGDDGFIWWSLERGAWVRSDIVTEAGECNSVPTVESDMMMDESMDESTDDTMEEPTPEPAMEEPAATEEAGS